MFADGWTTDKPIRVPGHIRKRSYPEYAITIGTWTLTDLDAITTAPDDTAFLVAFFNTEEYKIPFSIQWEQEHLARGDRLTLYPRWTMDKARVEALRKFDRLETERVTQHNFDLTVCWVRSRLVQQVRAMKGQLGSIGLTPCGPGLPPLPIIDTTKLVKLRLFADKIGAMGTLVQAFEKSAAARPLRIPQLQDIAPVEEEDAAADDNID